MSVVENLNNQIQALIKDENVNGEWKIPFTLFRGQEDLIQINE